MAQICTSSALPTFKSIYDSTVASMTFPPSPISIPPLPGIPNPVFGDYSNINLEIVQVVQGLQDLQLQMTLSAITTPLATILGGSLDDLLPKIPGTDLGLSDLLANDPNAIKLAIQEAIAINGVGIFPLVPDPMFTGLSAPSLETNNIVKMVIKGFYGMLITTITDLISQVTDLLVLAGLPAIPTIPTLPEVTAAMLAAFPGFPNIGALVKSGISLPDLFGAISFPGMPALVMPSPLVPSMSNYEAEFQEGMSVLYGDFTTAPLTIIVDFCETTLGTLGFEFPTVCVTV